jgi:hypothetical protein
MTLERPPYTPDLAAADVYLFPRLKSALKGWSFCDATQDMKNVTDKLKRLWQYGFLECCTTPLQSLSEGYSYILKETKLKWLYAFVFHRNKVIPGTFRSYSVFRLSVYGNAWHEIKILFVVCTCCYLCIRHIRVVTLCTREIQMKILKVQ